MIINALLSYYKLIKQIFPLQWISIIYLFEIYQQKVVSPRKLFAMKLCSISCLIIRLLTILILWYLIFVINWNKVLCYLNIWFKMFHSCYYLNDVFVNYTVFKFYILRYCYFKILIYKVYCTAKHEYII